MADVPNYPRTVNKLFLALIMIGVSLTACILPHPSEIPEDYCFVQTDNHFYPRLRGRPNSNEQIFWLSNSEHILLVDGGGKLHLVDAQADSSQDVRYTGLQGLWFALAPESETVAVLTNADEGGVVTRIYDLQSLDLITEIPDLGRASFSPDERFLAGAMEDSDEGWVSVISLYETADHPIEILPTEKRRLYYLEGWSHRQEWVAITRSTSSGIKIQVVEWKKGITIPLHEFLGCQKNSSWSQVTDEIAYQGNPNDNWDILIEYPGADNVRNLTSTDEANEYQPAWSPNGRQIAYVGVNFVPGKITSWQDLFVIDVETGEKVQITDTQEEYESMPVWSPDGTKIAYLSERGGDLFLYTIEPGGMNRTELARVSNPD